MNAFLSEFASTNARIAVSLLLAILLALTWLVGTMLHRIDAAALESFKWLALVITVWMGLDITQFGIKRFTWDADAHTTPPREDVQPPKPPTPAPTPEAP